MGKPYLSSRLSRRFTWKWVFVFVGLMGGYNGSSYVSGQHTPWYVIAMFAIGMCLASRMDSASLLTDWFVSCNMCFTVVMDAQYASVETFQSSTEGFSTGALSVILITGVLGVSSTCLMCMSVVLSVYAFADPRTTADDKMTLPIDLFLVTSFSSVLEACIAFVLQDLHEQHTITSLLLDTATDGFGSVDMFGVISSASSYLCENLGVEECAGQELAAFIEPADVAKLDDLIHAAERGHLPEQALVCFRCDKCVFDAMICPYYVGGRQLGFFIRKLGEVRAYSKDEAMSVARPLATVFEELPTMETTVDDNDSEISFAISATTITTKRRALGTSTKSVATQTHGQPPALPRAHRRYASGKSSHAPSIERGHISKAQAFQASLSNACLRSTTVTIRRHALLRLLRQWNIQIQEKCCCVLHYHIKECMAVLKMLKRMPCESRDEFGQKMGDEQCDRCGMVNFDTDLDEEDADEQQPCAWCSSCTVGELYQFESDAAMKLNRREQSSGASASSMSSRKSSLERRLAEVESDSS